MALTFLMMSGAAPVITAGIAWKFDAEGEALHLPAFLLSFTVAIFLYSPTFIARNTAVRMVTGRASLWRFVGFYGIFALLCGIAMVLVSQVDCLGDFIICPEKKPVKSSRS